MTVGPSQPVRAETAHQPLPKGHAFLVGVRRVDNDDSSESMVADYKIRRVCRDFALLGLFLCFFPARSGNFVSGVVHGCIVCHFIVRLGHFLWVQTSFRLREAEVAVEKLGNSTLQLVELLIAERNQVASVADKVLEGLIASFVRSSKLLQVVDRNDDQINSGETDELIRQLGRRQHFDVPQLRDGRE